MDNKIRFVINALIGFIIGLLIDVILFSFFIDYSDINSRWFVFAQFIGSGLFGAVCMGGTIVYNIESWGLLKATITHYLMVFVSFIIVDTLLGWFPYNILLITVAIGTVMYFIIWLIQFLIWKRKIKQLNNDLEIMHSKDKNRG